MTAPDGLGLLGLIMLFQLANAAMLPILAGILAMRSPETAALVLSICILVPQFVVVAIAPWIGVKAQNWGRRPLLLPYLLHPVGSWCNIRSDKRSLFAHCGAIA